jgi:hypothetical protein
MAEKEIKYKKEVEVTVDINFPAYRKYIPDETEKYYKFLDNVVAYEIEVDKKTDGVSFRKRNAGINMYTSDFILGNPPYDLSEVDWNVQLDIVKGYVNGMD